jgi:DNA repair protein RecN (Recombination protein N)
MLRQLNISNYALIDAVELQFHKGMTAITGETGSGKSILLGAFGLLLGERAESKAIKNEKVKCIVEAVFDLKGYDLKPFFKENDLDYDAHTTIRREISAGGKSRAFINDTPVQLATLRTLGNALVDIHSQHENSLLGQRSFQFETIDAFAGNAADKLQYTQLFEKYKSLKSELDNLLHNEAKMRQELDYTKFQWAELDKAALENINQQSMEQELETLTHAEQIKGVLNTVITILDGENSSVITQLSGAKSQLQKVTHFNTQLEDFFNRAQSSIIEIRELAREIEGYEANVVLDERQVEILNEKLSALYHLQQKHRMQSTAELIELRNELEQKCGGFDNLDDRIEELKKRLDQSIVELELVAKKISDSRKRAAVLATREVKKYFEALSLEHAELQVELVEANSFNEFGKDEIQFLFKANKGGHLLPVRQVASGGEISRVMLAIKASISRHKKLPVLILDEIDQGVSGEVGNKIGLILKEMSAQMQLLTITHLPQIAGKAENHLKVFKITTGHTTSTKVEELIGDERINELAEMLSGKTLTKAALENARELLGN